MLFFLFLGEQNRSLLVSNKSLPLFVPLLLSTSKVDTLWVYSYLGRFLWGDLFGLMWSSIRVLVSLEDICSFRVLVCHESWWISWTRIHVFHYCPALSNLIFAFSVVLGYLFSSAKLWVTTSLLMSPGLFSVFKPISIMLLFRWSPLVLLFPSLPVLLIILWWLYQEYQLQLV